jgi:hypothetical protein
MNRPRLILSVLTASLVAAGARGADAFEIDFRAGAANPVPWQLYGPDAASLAKPDDKGLRINLPTDRGEPGREVGVTVPLRLRGDFEVTLGYELLPVGEPVPESGAGVQLRVLFDAPVAAGMTRLRKLPKPDESKLFDVVGPNGETFGATRYDIGPNGKEKADVLNRRAAAPTGRLRLRRVGSKMEYWVADGSGDFRRIRTMEIGVVDATTIRAFGFSGYQPVAVDVRLTGLTVMGVRAAAAPVAEKTYAKEYHSSLKGDVDGRQSWNFFGPDAEQYLKFEPNGLRFTLPAGGGAQGRPGTGVSIPITVKGDFEITVNFEILDEPGRLSAGPGQTRITLDAVLDRPGVMQQSNVATLSRRMLFWEGQQFFTWLRLWDETTGKHLQDGHGFSTSAKAGRLRLVRTGADVAYYAAYGPDAELRFLHRNSFGKEDLRAVQFNAATGGPAAAIDVLLTDLVVRADGLANVPGMSGGWRASWLLAIGGVVVLGLFGTRLALRRAAAAPAAKKSTDKAAAATIRPARLPLLAVALLVIGIYAGSIWANRNLAVIERRDFRYIPPFMPYVDANMNSHLGAEYFHIAQSLVSGDGFANPFPGKSGPTAWMPPILPSLEASLLWWFDGRRDSVMAAVVFLQVTTLILSGLLVIAIVHRTAGRLGAWLAAVAFLAAVACDFHTWFQFTHDCWIILLALDLIIAAVVWWRPMTTWKTAAGWGVFGGLSALVSPIVGFVWGVLSLAFAARDRRLRIGLGIAILAAGLVLAPWTIRNYVVLGRLIPVKSNAAYELYQSQCLTPDGLIRSATFATHPNNASSGRERREYGELGEMAFLDRKREQFWQSVKADPQEFLDRAADRLFAATVWYVPFNREDPLNRPVAFWINRVTYPLPFLAAVFLLVTAARRPLHPIQWTVLGIYAFYLLPYVVVSYYQRYSAPLLAVNVLLVVLAVERCVRMVFRPRSPGIPARVEKQPAPVARSPVVPVMRSRRFARVRLAMLFALIGGGVLLVFFLAGPRFRRPETGPDAGHLLAEAEKVRAGKSIFVDARNHPDIRDKDLEVLLGLTNLRIVNLDTTPITDEGVKRLAGIPSIDTVSLTRTAITDAGLAALGTLTDMNELRLDATAITDAGLAHLKAFPRLRVLSLYQTGITDAGLVHLKCLTALRRLSLDETRVSDEGLKELSGLSDLRYLSVWKTSVTDAGVRDLKAKLPGLKINR